MTIFSEFGFRGSHGPLENAQGFALEQLVSVQCVTTDLRWAMVELAWRSAVALFAFARGRLLTSARGQHTLREEEADGQHCCC